MYNSLERNFNKKAPLSEIINAKAMLKSTEYYFLLLDDYGISLNTAQQEAVRTVSGPVLVVAGAGSGKTTVLTSRIGYMVHERDIDPASILLVTFTKKASTEMIERLGRIPGISRQAAHSVHAGTYHSICLRILRAEGFDFQVLASERKQHMIIKRILKKMELHESYSPEAVLNVISGWKNTLITPAQVEPGSDVIVELQSIYKQYEAYKTSENLFDFDDILLEAYYLMLFREDVLTKYQEQYQYILCDEFQDTSFVQYEIIRMLAKPHDNLCIVGDDAQTIYSFRSAKSTFMLDFPNQYPTCKRIIMDINYRSTSNIVGIANALIKNNKKQIEKQLKSIASDSLEVMYHQPKSSDEEAAVIVDDIKRKIATGVSLGEIAIIYRTHATGRAIFDKLIDADLPFVTFSKRTESFYENTFVKPILSVLKAVHDSTDTDAIIEAAPIFYISRADMKTALAHLIADPIEVPSDLLKKALIHIANQKTGYFKQALIRKADSLFSLRNMKAAAAILEIRKGEIDYERQLEVDGRKTLSLHKEMVIETLDEIEQAARGFESIKSFLLFVERVIEKNKEMEKIRQVPDLEAVKLMTIHTSKGLEFDCVYGIGWSEGILPHASSIKSSKAKEDSDLTSEELLAEERRLGYVAVTRAKRYLHLSSPQQHRGRKVQISRFVEEAMELQKEVTIPH